MEENKMGVMPVNKLLISMALHDDSMLVQALYNIVDSMFVAQISEKRPDGGFSGVSCAEPDDCCRHRVRVSVSMHWFPVLLGKETANAQT